jgi:CO/xanthine dehydrogenase FAD-binding subunit
MVKVSAYKRPASLEEALVALEHRHTVVVGGGTRLRSAPGAEPVVVVDLQAAGLEGVRPTRGGGIVVGATTTLADLATSPDLSEVVRDAARREQPSSLRAMSTLGGCVASADFESELLATLLVYRATVTLAGKSGVSVAPLATFLAEPGQLRGRIIVAVELETGGDAAVARVGRTSADRAIVAAVARRDPQGTLLLAFSGVAQVPVVTGDPEALEPPSDFRASGEYRRAMAVALAARAREALR